MENTLFSYLERYITLTQEEKEVFEGLNLFKNYSKGHFLLKEREYARCSYFVIQGCLRCYYIKNGEEKTTAFYLEEESLTPESLTTNQPSAYFIACEEESLLLVSDPEMEETVFEKFPKFESLCRILSEKEIAKQQSNFAQFVSSSPEERYVHLLQTKPQLFQRVPQYQIASYLGMKPESLSRIRKRISQKPKKAS